MDGGVRIHVDYRGRGLMNQLTGYVDQYMKNKYSSICQKKTACLNTEENLEKLKRHPERCIVWEKVSDHWNKVCCTLKCSITEFNLQLHVPSLDAKPKQ